MATRSRTQLFLQYRNSFGRTPKPRNSGAFTSSESASLIPANQNDVVIELENIPPRWVDMMDGVDELIEQIKVKILQLATMHKKHLLPGFDDRSSDEQSIESLTSDITKSFHECQRRIKDIASLARSAGYSPQELKMSQNVQTSLGAKVQEVLTSFRKSQADYLKKMGGGAAAARGKSVFHQSTDSDDESNDDFDIGFTDQQLAAVTSNEAAITQREKEINEIAKSIFQVAEIFKEMQSLVIDQGTLLDRIDYNVEQVSVNIQGAVVQLEEGTKYQKKSRNKQCMLLLILVIFGLVLVLLFKLGKK